jgi:D-alanyl-D-alanine carboxypeptidase
MNTSTNSGVTENYRTDKTLEEKKGMMSMIRFLRASILYVVFGWFMTLAPIAYAQADFSQQLQTALDTLVDNPDSNFSGAILYVSQPDKGTWLGSAGVADIETGAPLSLDASFRAGSIMKPFVAVTVLQLIEEGKLSLETLMTEVLPEEYKSLFANAGRITVRMLLEHSSGIPEWLTPGAIEQISAEPTKVWKVSEFLGLAAAQPAVFAPGEGYSYSNTDYNLLGLIIENVTGMSWREAVAERVITPLGLQHTKLPAPGDNSMPEGFMHGYEPLNGGMVDLSLTDPSMAGAAGGGALVTTVADLARFMAALRGGELFQQEETLSEMMTFIDAPDEGGQVGYGLGLQQYMLPGGLELIGHLGSTAGYRAFTGYFPGLDLSIALAFNSQADPTPLILAALDVVSPEQPDPGTALQGLLDDQVQEQGILGMIMAVRLPDGTVISRSSGYTDPAGENTWSLDTQSALGSITKTFTAVVIMQLVQEGKLSLDDTIDTWFPDQPNADKITVRMLLSHTSGLANFISRENERDPKWSHEWAPLELIAEANKLGPVAEPGSKVAHYANTNYFLLGLITEKVTGNSWEQEVRSRIIEPLGLEDTTFLSQEGVWGGSMVAGYTKTPAGYLSILDIPNLPHATTAWAAGAVVSTLSDLLTFASALFDGTLVSKETLSQMATPLGTDAESGRLWGLGGATLEELPAAFGMGGDVPGYHAFFVGIQDSQVVVAALVNTEEGDVVAPGLMALEYMGKE